MLDVMVRIMDNTLLILFDLPKEVGVAITVVFCELPVPLLGVKKSKEVIPLPGGGLLARGKIL